MCKLAKWWHHTLNQILFKYEKISQAIFTKCAPQNELNSSVTMATYRPHHIKSFFGHLWHSILIFVNSTSYAWSSKHINMSARVCGLVSGTKIKFLPLDFLGVSLRIPWKKKNSVYRLQISALVPEIFTFEKWVKYANEMTDDVIHSTKYCIEYMNRAILANLQCRTLELSRLIVLHETHLWL